MGKCFAWKALVFLLLSIAIFALIGTGIWYLRSESQAKKNHEINEQCASAEACFQAGRWQAGCAALNDALKACSQVRSRTSELRSQESLQMLRVVETLESPSALDDVANTLTSATLSAWVQTQIPPQQLRTSSRQINKRLEAFLRENRAGLIAKIQERDKRIVEEIKRKQTEESERRLMTEETELQAKAREEARIQHTRAVVDTIAKYKTMPLDAEITLRGTFLYVRNKNPFSWNTATVSVNPEEYLLYTLTLSELEPNRTVQLNLKDFMTNSGSRFTPEYSGVQKVAIYAVTVYGEKIFVAQLVHGTHPGEKAQFVPVGLPPVEDLDLQ